MPIARKLATWSLCVAAALAGAGAPAADPPAPSRIQVQTLNAVEFDLDRLRGRVVVVHFWATWCPPCIKEMPELEAFYEKYRDRGVEVIALSEDRTRDLEEVHHMIHHMNATYPVAMAHRATANSFGEPATLPVTYVLDGSGAVRATLRPDTDPLTVESLSRAVDPLLR